MKDKLASINTYSLLEEEASRLHGKIPNNTPVKFWFEGKFYDAENITEAERNYLKEHLFNER